MGKKRATKTVGVPGSTRELRGDPGNPSQIGKRAAAGLRASLSRFGDIAGIVFNSRTNELVCGHKRLRELRGQFGDLPVEAAEGGGVIRCPDGSEFRVRVVDWDRTKQYAANVAANSQELAGRFNDDLGLRLAELKEADQTQYSELLFAKLEEKPEPELPESYDVVITCMTPEERDEVVAELQASGRKYRTMTRK